MSHWCKGTSALTDSVWHLLHPGSDLTMIQPLWPVFRHVVESPGQPMLNTEPVLWGGLSLLLQRVILLFKYYRDTSSLMFFTTETAALYIFAPDRSFISFPGASNDSTWASLECYFNPRCCYVYCHLSEQLSNVYCSKGLWGTPQWQWHFHHGGSHKQAIAVLLALANWVIAMNTFRVMTDVHPSII